MTDEINIIRAYANDSLNYGKKSGNVKATKRGTDVLFALSKLEDDLKKVEHLNKLIHANQRTLLQVEDTFAKRIDPSNYDTMEEWRNECQVLRDEIND